MMILNALPLSLFVSLHLVLIQQEVNLWLFASDRDLDTHSGVIHDVLNVKCVFDVLNVII
jgi:hypothetical protein